MEPVLGFEPRTDGLQNRCSTTELNWLNASHLESAAAFSRLLAFSGAKRRYGREANRSGA